MKLHTMYSYGHAGWNLEAIFPAINTMKTMNVLSMIKMGEQRYKVNLRYSPREQ
jgi:hypothetical protein